MPTVRNSLMTDSPDNSFPKVAPNFINNTLLRDAEASFHNKRPFSLKGCLQKRVYAISDEPRLYYLYKETAIQSAGRLALPHSSLYRGPGGTGQIFFCIQYRPDPV